MSFTNFLLYRIFHIIGEFYTDTHKISKQIQKQFDIVSFL